jgi:hypothetical protein
MDLSSTHWTARGLFSFSLVSSIIAVYYASSQHRVMGRFLNASQVKSWIENISEGAMDKDRARFGFPGLGAPQLRKPAVSSVLTISAPVILLSASLNSFLAGFGVYLGTIWTKSLDNDAGPGGSRNVFLVYVIGLGVCYGVYALSSLVSRGRATDGHELEDLLLQLDDRGRNDGLESPPRHPPSTGERFRMSPFTADERSLVQAIYEAATLREESAEADRRVADIYREFSRQVQTHDRAAHGSNYRRPQTAEGESSTHQ